MISFTLSLVALVLGYMFYGRFVEKIIAPDDRSTPAISMADGVDYVVLPGWKIFMIQFLNIAGTGPIFGAIMGAQFGPSCYLWIVFGCIFAGAMHDYLSGMLSLRNGGVGLPQLVGKYLGNSTKQVMLVFTVFLLIMVGAVFVYSPAEIMHSIGGDTMMWICIIFAYYVISTVLPIDKIIGRIYPLFAFALFFMAAGLLVVLFLKWPTLPEVWDGLGNKALTVVSEGKWSGGEIWPCLFITIACGAISGFHATQSPLMARCMKSEKQGRPIFYGAMITEGVVALIWATVSAYFFYGEPAPGYQLIEAVNNKGFNTSAPAVVDIICNDWLGVVGGVLALLGVVAAPITSGDTAFRSARLIIAEFLKVEQKSIRRRLCICLPLFGASIVLLWWQIENPNGFNIIWQYFGWANQALSVFTLWTLTVFLVREKKPYWVSLIPAFFMTTVCSTFIFVSKQALGLPLPIGYSLGVLCLVVAIVWFFVWKGKYKKSIAKE